MKNNENYFTQEEIDMIKVLILKKFNTLLSKRDDSYVFILNCSNDDSFKDRYKRDYERYKNECDVYETLFKKVINYNKEKD